MSLLARANMLGEKLGPIVFQFPNFNKDSFSNPNQFFSRLKAFLKKLPRNGGYKFAIEIRNKWWLTLRFANLLRENDVALVPSKITRSCHQWIAYSR